MVGDKDVKKVIKDLVDSMRSHGLVGMAAPQIGVNKRIFVTEIRKTKFRKKEELDGVRVFVNPRITKYSKETYFADEGCGSVANSNLFAKVKRHKSIEVSALNENGEKVFVKMGGLLAHVIQHELDHLDGKVFLDREFDPKSLMSASEYLEYKKRK